MPQPYEISHFSGFIHARHTHTTTVTGLTSDYVSRSAGVAATACRLPRHGIFIRWCPSVHRGANPLSTSCRVNHQPGFHPRPVHPFSFPGDLSFRRHCQVELVSQQLWWHLSASVDRRLHGRHPGTRPVSYLPWAVSNWIAIFFTMPWGAIGIGIAYLKTDQAIKTGPVKAWEKINRPLPSSPPATPCPAGTRKHHHLPTHDCRQVVLVIVFYPATGFSSGVTCHGGGGRREGEKHHRLRAPVPEASVGPVLSVIGCRRPHTPGPREGVWLWFCFKPRRRRCAVVPAPGGR